MSALYRIEKYLTASRIVLEGAPSGVYVEQHACPHVAARRLEALNATAKPKARKVPTPVVEPGATPGKTAELPLDVADLSVLDGSLSRLATALGDGTCDDYLAALLEAEENGKTRKGAVAMIKSRMGEVA
jgi:hypothetical protein